MTDDESPEEKREKALKAQKAKRLKWQLWQGREDADMLLEKKSDWHCRADGSASSDDDSD